MGILWTVWPIDDDMKSYLDKEGINYPCSPSRFPTGQEVKGVLKGMTDYKIEYYDNGLGNSWQANIQLVSNPEESWTLLNISEFTGDLEPQQLWFDKGDENLIKSILKLLSNNSGPLTLIADCGGPPQIIKT